MTALAHKISFKIIAILVLSGGLLAAYVSFLGDKAGQDIAQRGVVAVAEVQTASVADQLYGPLRFNRLDDANAILSAAAERTDLLVGFFVTTRDGSTISWPENQFSEEEIERLSALSASVLETNAAVSQNNGMILALPVHKEPGSAGSGALVALWTAEPFLTTIAYTRRKQILSAAAGLAVLVLLSAVAVRAALGKPIQEIDRRAASMADGDLTTAVPGTDRKSEMGALARSLEGLRQNLAEAKVATDAAFYDAAGFQASSAAQVMCDPDLCITQWNKAFRNFLESLDARLASRAEIGQMLDFFAVESLNADALRDASFPLNLEFRHANEIVGLSVQVLEADGERQGYVLELRKITEAQKTSGILAALEETAVRADFGEDAQLVSMNGNLAALLGSDAVGRPAAELIRGPDGEDVWAQMTRGGGYQGKFTIGHGQATALIDGSISIIKDRAGRHYAFVVLGTDISSSEADLVRAKEATEKLISSQSAVVSSLRSAL